MLLKQKFLTVTADILTENLDKFHCDKALTFSSEKNNNRKVEILRHAKNY